MDHKAEFTLLVQNAYGKAISETIDWSEPRLVCIAGDFTKYDEHAVHQINRNIELIRYRRFGDDLLLLELANAASAASGNNSAKVKKAKSTNSGDKPISQWLANLPKKIESLFSEFETFTLSLGDDVQRKDLKLYIAFKRLRNFATVVFQNKAFRLFLTLDPEKQIHIEKLTRDVTNIGHWGTGRFELLINNSDDLEKAKPYIKAAYNGETS